MAIETASRGRLALPNREHNSFVIAGTVMAVVSLLLVPAWPSAARTFYVRGDFPVGRRRCNIERLPQSRDAKLQSSHSVEYGSRPLVELKAPPRAPQFAVSRWEGVNRIYR